MSTNGVRFSILRHAAWAPGITTPLRWAEWAAQPWPIVDEGEPGVRQMNPMLRRRAGTLGKMALEVAYECLEDQVDIPGVFCSRHGDVARAVDLLGELGHGTALSPTNFGLAVHNAIAGLFSIARCDQANQIAIAADASTVEHGVIEACGLLTDGAPMVQLVVYDMGLPAIFTRFEDCHEQAHAFSWLMVAATSADLPIYQLSWQPENRLPNLPCAAPSACQPEAQQPGSLAVLQFQLSGAPLLERVANGRRWHWSYHAAGTA